MAAEMRSCVVIYVHEYMANFDGTYVASYVTYIHYICGKVGT